MDCSKKKLPALKFWAKIKCLCNTASLVLVTFNSSINLKSFRKADFSLLPSVSLPILCSFLNFLLSSFLVLYFSTLSLFSFALVPFQVKSFLVNLSYHYTVVHATALSFLVLFREQSKDHVDVASMMIFTKCYLHKSLSTRKPWKHLLYYCPVF
jgi:hypothetical protein